MKAIKLRAGFRSRAQSLCGCRAAAQMFGAGQRDSASNVGRQLPAGAKLPSKSLPFGGDPGGCALGLNLRQHGFLGDEQALDGSSLGLVQVSGRQELRIMLDVQFGDGLVHR